MLRIWSRRIAAATLGFLTGGSCFAEDCRFLNRDPLQLRDRQLFFRSKSADGWMPIDEVRPDLASQSVEFAYVIRESIDPARAGVVILKSARVRRLDEPSAGRSDRKVRLVRQAQSFDNAACGPVPRFDGADVPAQSYDRYHDEGRNVPQKATLRTFHFRYAARNKTCHTTDDGTQDSLVPWDPRSNRSQFSFDPNVVSGGTYSQALAWTGVARAYAGSESLDDQRVELKQYRVDASLPTCVVFRLPELGRGSFLRINDLEGLIANGLRYTRASESQWNLAP